MRARGFIYLHGPTAGQDGVPRNASLSWRICQGAAGYSIFVLMQIQSLIPEVEVDKPEWKPYDIGIDTEPANVQGKLPGELTPSHSLPVFFD